MYNVQVLKNVALRDAITPDQLEKIGGEIATFAAQIGLAEHALITRLRLFDAHDGWANSGFFSCAQWLIWRTNIGPKAAREKVRVARALATLEQVDACFGRGELSYSKVRAITRVATPENEQDLIDIAMHATAAQVERLTRAYRRVGVLSQDPADAANQTRSQRRFLRRNETADGMVRFEIQLPPEEATVIWDAMMSASDVASATPDRPQAVASAEASAEASACPAVPESANDGEQLEQQRADAIVNVARGYLKHRPRTLGSGYELVVITTNEQLEHGQNGIGGFLPDGTPLPLHVAQMLACDSARVDVTVGEHGALLDVGRSTRTIPSAIGRALWLRDGGCRAPGCDRKQHLHGHHIKGWAEGGPTHLSNLVLVCPGHHRLIHEGTLSVEIRDSKIMFIDQRGRCIPAVPPSVTSAHDLEDLERFHAQADLYIDPSINVPKWDGTPMDLADSLAWMFIADQTRLAS